MAAGLPLKGDTVIGNDVWMNHNITILPGVRIGGAAIIASNTAVTRNVPAMKILEHLDILCSPIKK